MDGFNPFMFGAGRELPSHVPIENALIGALFVHGQKAWEHVAGRLQAEQFFDPTNAEIFAAIAHLAGQGRPFSPPHLQDRVTASAEALHAKCEVALTMCHLSSCVELVAGSHARRQIIKACQDTTARAYEPGLDDTTSDLIVNLQRELELVPVSDKATGLDIQPWVAPDPVTIPPRSWLYGNMLIRGEVMMLAARPGAGKTAFTSVVSLALAANRALTGHHVHRRCRVLSLHLEEDDNEFARRMAGAMLHHGVTDDDVRGWIYHRGIGDGLIICREMDGRVIAAPAFDKLRDCVRDLQIDVVIVDPFVTTYEGSENDNKVQDGVTRLWKRLAAETNSAVWINHHVRKGSNTPGDPDAARGGGAQIGTARGVFTLMPMSEQEATTLGIDAKERRRIIRFDDAKGNMALGEPEKWYRLHSVDLGNGNDEHPQGDNVQAVEQWTPPDAFAGMSNHLCCEILNRIDEGLPEGERYSEVVTANERWAGNVIIELAGKTPAEAKIILKKWLKNKVIKSETYRSGERRESRKGLYVNRANMPGAKHD